MSHYLSYRVNTMTVLFMILTNPGGGLREIHWCPVTCGVPEATFTSQVPIQLFLPYSHEIDELKRYSIQSFREKALKMFKSSLTEGGEFDAMMLVMKCLINCTVRHCFALFCVVIWLSLLSITLITNTCGVEKPGYLNLWGYGMHTVEPIEKVLTGSKIL